jgi:hypothetical protein
MKVAILTETQNQSLYGQFVQTDWYFYPVQDCNGNWVISQEEIENSIYPQNEWIKSLPLIDYCPKPQPPFPTID